uniref:Cyclopropane-fatty-acyl-phospholipid synthase n=1 Tax=Globisporangium ultimum (strain ATCC 200006 / CBS 805.95 / DAOM BR144) TaxID=431595 RepID=K3WIC9_GLOUD
MASAKRETALITALVVREATLASFLLRAPMKPLLRAQAVILIKGMLVDTTLSSVGDITVQDDSMFFDWATRGMLGIGESYITKKWDAIVPLDEVLARLQILLSDKKRKLFKSWTARFVHVATRIFNYQSQSRAGMVGARKESLGLRISTRNKLRVIAEKLKLEAGMRILDIGCGWGGLACYLAKNYGVHVTGVTILNEQLKGARERAAKQGISHLTKFEYRNYRDGQRDNGVAIVHGTTSNRSLKVPIELWMLQYIFPIGFVPSIAQTLEFAERKFVVEDVHNFGPDYEKTLLCWHHHFQQSVRSGATQRPEVFVRMWDFYLLYCVVAFRTRVTQLSQVVFTKQRAQRYDTVR